MAETQLIEEVLALGELDIEGRLIDASNLACLATAHLNGHEVRCIYKPAAGERPLWDFPSGTLSRREVAAYRLSEVAGWAIVPITVWREDGPAGEGMCQMWIEVSEERTVVDVVPRGRVPEGWRHVIDAEGARGRPVALVHDDSNELRRMAVFDAVVNNADRKGGHVLVDDQGRVHGIDHGVTFHEDDKLRTVLWGWAGESLGEALMTDLDGLATSLTADGAAGLSELLDRHEVERTVSRVRRLLSDEVFPYPGDGWPSLPWPAF